MADSTDKFSGWTLLEVGLGVTLALVVVGFLWKMIPATNPFIAKSSLDEEEATK